MYWYEMCWKTSEEIMKEPRNFPLLPSDLVASPAQLAHAGEKSKTANKERVSRNHLLH